MSYDSHTHQSTLLPAQDVRSCHPESTARGRQGRPGRAVGHLRAQVSPINQLLDPILRHSAAYKSSKRNMHGGEGREEQAHINDIDAHLHLRQLMNSGINGQRLTRLTNILTPQSECVHGRPSALPEDADICAEVLGSLVEVDMA